MKKTFLIMAVLVVFVSTVYAEECKCTSAAAIRWGQVHRFSGEDPLFYNYLQYLTYGQKHMGKKEYLRAIEYFKSAIELERCLPEPYANIGWCYVQLGYENEAMEYYEKACERVGCDGLYTDSCYEYKKLRKKLLGY
jgi:tetratricopeptide (TPR) repeat protein